MERISTIQTASVITQPVDATEPLTLVEKLEQERSRLTKQANDDIDVVSKENHAYQVGLIGGLTNAIDIVKQHEAESWVSVDERLPENNVFVLVWLKSGYSEVLQRSEYEHPNEPSTFIWEKLCCNGYFTDWDITAWQPIQPPSEVQGD